MEKYNSFPLVKDVKVLPGKRLLVTFVTGEEKTYDCAGLLRDKAYASLKKEEVFRAVRPEEGGYGIVWQNGIELSEADLWLQGKSVESKMKK